MQRLCTLLVLLALTACSAPGYRQDALHRSPASAGAPEVSTGPTADPDAHGSALPRALVARGRDWRGNVVPIGVMTGIVLLAALGLGVYTIVIAFRRPPER
jgi:hypothetical protein